MSQAKAYAVGAACLLTACWLVGCAHYQPQELSPAQTAQQLDERSLAAPALRTFLETNLQRELTGWPKVSWDLDMLTLAGLCYQPSLEVARAQWLAARGGEVTAGQRPNPVLTVTPAYNATALTPSPWLPLGFVDVPIETAGKRGHRRAQAAYLAESARLNLASAAWQVRSELRSRLLEFAAADQRATHLGQQISLQEQILHRLDQQAQAGALASTEMVPIRIAREKTRLDLAEAQRQRVEARGRIAEAVGVPLRALDDITLNFDWLQTPGSIDQLTSVEARRMALQSRPDILGLLAEFRAAQSALQLEIAKQYPDVHLQPGYEFDQGSSKWSLGLVVDLPLLNQNQGPIAEATARRSVAAANFSALQAKIMAEIDRDVALLRAAEQNLAALGVLKSEQLKRQTAVEAQFKAGALEPLDWLNVQLESAAAELVQLDGQLKLQQALGALEDAVQRPIYGRLATAFFVPATPAGSTKPRTN